MTPRFSKTTVQRGISALLTDLGFGRGYKYKAQQWASTDAYYDGEDGGSPEAWSSVKQSLTPGCVVSLWVYRLSPRGGHEPLLGTVTLHVMSEDEDDWGDDWGGDWDAKSWLDFFECNF